MGWAGLAGRLGGAALAGTAAACAAALPFTGRYYEDALLAAAIAFLLTALAVCTATDAATARRSTATAGSPARPG